MIITRLFLRNYRVYEGEVELELPAGLIGIYGPNGAGKSYLVESILWTLYGRSRTDKQEVRTAGVQGDCVCELEFVHEGHPYVARRVLAGPRFEVRCSVSAAGVEVAHGVKEVERYLESILGLNEESFRASVFAEQKQMAAFSAKKPAERKELVLALLGVKPLDQARDQARQDSRRAREDLEKLRPILPDLDELSRQKEQLRRRAREAEQATAAAAERLREADDALAEIVGRLQGLREKIAAREAVVEEGKRLRRDLESRRLELERLEEDRRLLEADREKLDELEARFVELDVLESQLALLDDYAKAKERLSRAQDALARMGAAGGEEELARLEQQRSESQRAQTEAQVEARQAALRVRQAREALKKLAGLKGEAVCPLCGQELGESFLKVRAHWEEELAGQEETMRRLEAEAKAQAGRIEELSARIKQVQAVLGKRRELEVALRDAQGQLESAQAALGSLDPEWADRDDLARSLEEAKRSKGEWERIQGRLEAMRSLEEQIERHRSWLAESEERLRHLRAKAAELQVDQAELPKLEQAVGEARAKRQAAERDRGEAEATQRATEVELAGIEGRILQGQEQLARLRDLEDEARNLGKVAELLSAFRDNVVATIGPQLAAHAAELFAELTDHDYESLEVDPDNYEIRIRDQGVSWGLARFSGSEVDLANLALRVAISEHISFMSGGSLGLLVLDEVFGPLDEARRDRMLDALERLRSRFQQILVVTHGDDIKQRLPHAIQVHKLPGRRARLELI
jgi:exonuclease SbcC